MKATRRGDGIVHLALTEAEAVVLHEAIAAAEFAEDLEVVELDAPAERRVFADVQQALASLIPGLGTERYGDILQEAQDSIDPSPF